MLGAGITEVAHAPRMLARAVVQEAYRRVARGIQYAIQYASPLIHQATRPDTILGLRGSYQKKRWSVFNVLLK